MSRGVFSTRVLYFEVDEEDRARPPEEYPEQAAVAVSTHDLPTLSGFWRGRDLEIYEELDLFGSPDERDRRILERTKERVRLLTALEREDLLPEGVRVLPTSVPEMTPALSRAVHRYLARAPSRLLLVQLADIVGEPEPVNVPAAGGRYPSWRQRIDLPVGEISRDPDALALAEQLREERPRGERPFLSLDPRRAEIPRATYRLQLHREFGFADAERIVPYLAALGISHCYVSPLLTARPGSPHGYDIVDHRRLNPELGGSEGLDRFVDALQRHEMGLVVDVVPNHMGIRGRENGWWIDVLENGQASRFARYFDIDWRPTKEALRGKVLIPILGGPYGRELEEGRLGLGFDPEGGSFHVTYYEHFLPLDPRSYPQVLQEAAALLRKRSDVDAAVLPELESLITAFGHLPAHDASDPAAIETRARDKEIHKRTLRALCERSGELRAEIEAVKDRVDLHALLEAQPYRLANWRVASDEINYRRFFDINDLAALRMERPEVFEATHRLLLDLIVQGKVQGLRIDHPDGLYDPKEYVRRLQSAIGREVGLPVVLSEKDDFRPLFIVVEKILASYERLREEWPIQGTTGYDFANQVNGWLVDGRNEAALGGLYARFLGRRVDFEEIVYDAKRLIIRTALASELNVLAGEIDRISEADPRTRDFTRIALRDALIELVACFPVYRTYVTSESTSEEDRRYVDWAVAQAKRRTPLVDPSIYDFIRSCLLLEPDAPVLPAMREAVVEFAMRFQQYTAPVTAKGLEDTAFYRYHRLVSLNEVGGDPEVFSLSTAALHQANADRARRRPHTMLAGSTHDSKRSLDVRARIDVISELPEEWRRNLFDWTRINRPKKTLVEGVLAPDRNDEYLLYQTLLGAWPNEELDGPGLDSFRVRVEEAMIKAAREAKVRTSWIHPDDGYERALRRFVQRVVTSAPGSRFRERFLPFQRKVARLGAWNSLSATVLQLASPGVPDLYQGNELFAYDLVDPDNRRAVDYEIRSSALERIRGEREDPAGSSRALLDGWKDGRIKQHVIARALDLRRRRPLLFRDGAYLPLEVSGDREDHVIAFARKREGDLAICVASRWFASLCPEDGDFPTGDRIWAGTRILWEEPPSTGRFRDVLSGVALAFGRDGDTHALPVGRVLSHLPVAFLALER
ncbi:MAG: malto-oligosyltrehalose synthase [Candidatus Eisenbacteria bacterium]|nr:malto-oligosyltrehalose synthase [Candidatus Latescibacterota bacterium]MBD3301887.1 malto-oligosyltrehalose synthase [Candidatus Eisenbacteria bacterium]